MRTMSFLIYTLILTTDVILDIIISFGDVGRE